MPFSFSFLISDDSCFPFPFFSSLHLIFLKKVEPRPFSPFFFRPVISSCLNSIIIIYFNNHLSSHLLLLEWKWNYSDLHVSIQFLFALLNCNLQLYSVPSTCLDVNLITWFDHPSIFICSRPYSNFWNGNQLNVNSTLYPTIGLYCQSSLFSSTLLCSLVVLLRDLMIHIFPLASTAISRYQLSSHNNITCSTLLK